MTLISAKAKSLTDNGTMFYKIRKIRGILIDTGSTSVSINYIDHTIAGSYDTVLNNGVDDIRFRHPYGYYLDEASAFFNITQNNNFGFAASFSGAVEINPVILDVKNTFINTAGPAPFIVEEILFRIVFDLSF